MVGRAQQPQSHGILRRFCLDKCGLATLEFAFIAPIMATLLTGMLELSQFLSAQRRVVEAAHICADLVSQESDVSSADLDDILSASRYVVTPFSDDNLRIGITSVRFNQDTGDAYQDWSYSYNGGSVTNPVTKAAGMGAAGKSVIIVSADYSYAPMLLSLFAGTVNINEVGYAKPRALSYVGKY